MSRENLQKFFDHYITNTFIYINRVKGFCKTISTWTGARKTELEKIKNEINQPDLAAVLKDTLMGLGELDCFLDAVEKLAVTSLHVFDGENQMLHLPKEICLEHVQHLIVAARVICPLLLKFKRDASVFFSPRLQNVEVLAYHLDQYIQTTQIICDNLEKRCDIDFYLKNIKETNIVINVDLTEDDIQRMLCHIEQLAKMRMDPNFRMVFLFQGVSCSGFISEFSERQPRMLQSLKYLEENAVKLDRMNKGAKISSVVSSSVGVVGGVLLIIGLALIPVTFGVSAGLIIGGTAIGVTSGVNSVVTTATEIGVNITHTKKAKEVLQSFMKDVQALQACLEQVTGQLDTTIQMKAEYCKVLKLLDKSRSIGSGIISIAEDASALKVLAITGKGTVHEGKAFSNVPRVASEIPDIGQAAAKGSLALSKSARVGFIALNALFLGMDIFFICKDSISLARGSKTEVSQFIRARAALWSSEMDAWQKIHDSLSKGLKTAEELKAVLETLFYPEEEMKRDSETETEMERSDEVDETLKEKNGCVVQ